MARRSCCSSFTLDVRREEVIRCSVQFGCYFIVCKHPHYNVADVQKVLKNDGWKC